MLINIHDAKTHFSKIIERALRGEEIIIARSGKPLICLIPYATQPEYRKGGQFQGLIDIGSDFDTPLPEELLKKFYGEE